MQNAVLGFQTAGVTQVVFVSVSAETNLFLLLSTAAESQGYRPGYALTSAAALGVQVTNAPKAQLENVRAVGWLPSLDLGAGGGSPQSAACLKQLSAQSVNATSVLDRYFATTRCDVLALYAKALKATRGNASGASILTALRGLGTSFASAATLDAATDLGSAPGGGAAHGLRVAFGTSCGCFTWREARRGQAAADAERVDLVGLPPQPVRPVAQRQTRGDAGDGRRVPEVSAGSGRDLLLEARGGHGRAACVGHVVLPGRWSAQRASHLLHSRWSAVLRTVAYT